MKTVSQEHGFTLLELLLSLTILALVVVILSGAFRIGVRAWESGEEKIAHLQRVRIVFDLMKSQISSILFGNIGKPFKLKGDDNSLEFISSLPINQSNSYGMVHVRYIITTLDNNAKRLSFYENNMISPDEMEKELKENDFHDLIPSAYQIAFEYLLTHYSLFPDSSQIRENQNMLEWRGSWDPEKDQGFPKAVRIHYQKDPESAPVYVIARIIYEKPS